MECTFPSCFEIIFCSSKHFIFACKFHLIPFVIANQLAGYCPTVCISFAGSIFFCVSCTFRKRPKGNNLLEHVTEKTQTDIEINVHNLYLENEARHTYTTIKITLWVRKHEHYLHYFPSDTDESLPRLHSTCHSDNSFPLDQMKSLSPSSNCKHKSVSSKIREIRHGRLEKSLGFTSVFKLWTTPVHYHFWSGSPMLRFKLWIIIYWLADGEVNALYFCTSYSKENYLMQEVEGRKRCSITYIIL